jgi:hypothetical protein
MRPGVVGFRHCLFIFGGLDMLKGWCFQISAAGRVCNFTTTE